MRRKSRGPIEDFHTVENQLGFVDYTISIGSQSHHAVHAFNESVGIVYGAHTIQKRAALHIIALVMTFEYVEMLTCAAPRATSHSTLH